MSTHRQSVYEDDRDAECQMRAHGNWHMMKAEAISFYINAEQSDDNGILSRITVLIRHS